MTGAVVQVMSRAYPEVRGASGHVAEATRGEEERLIRDAGSGAADPQRHDREGAFRPDGQILQEPDVFKLYDTYGFPMDLITEACREQGLTVDEAGFDAAIEEQRNRAAKPAALSRKRPGRPLPNWRRVSVRRNSWATGTVGIRQHRAGHSQGRPPSQGGAEGDEVEVVLDVLRSMPKAADRSGIRASWSARRAA